MAPGTKHRIGFKQTAVELADGSFGQQNTSVPAGLIVSGAVSVAGTATQVVGENPGRVTLLVANAGNATVFLGNAAVASTTGYPLSAGSAMDLSTTAAVYAITATGTSSVRVLELANGA